MSLRGPARQYKIRKTTVNNETGDNFSITIPRIIAQQFSGCVFSMEIHQDRIIFTSGTKVMTAERIPQSSKSYLEGGLIIFR